MPVADAEIIDAKIAAYLKHKIFRMQGFCRQIDANLLRAIIVYQAKNDISGSLVEIGVWHGKSFFILAKGRAPGEYCLAADLFAIRPLTQGERQQSDEFHDNCRMASIELDPQEILIGDTLNIGVEHILDRVGPARLFHIDGAHDYDHVRHDLYLAQKALAERGVLVIDDTFNRQWPEVSAAAFDWLRENDDFAPFAVTEQKLYCARKADCSFYEKNVRASFEREIGRFTEMFGHRLLMLNTTRADAIQEYMKRAFLSPRQVQIPRAVCIMRNDVLGIAALNSRAGFCTAADWRFVFGANYIPAGTHRPTKIGTQPTPWLAARG